MQAGNISLALVNTKPLLTSVLLSICSPLSSYADVTVQPAGIKVIWNALKDEFDGFQTYNESKGIYVSLAVSGGEKSIISLDKKNSKASLFSGTQDLGAKLDPWVKFSKDRKTMRMEVESEKLPAGNTGELQLKGNISLVVASISETKSAELSALEKGDKLIFTDSFQCKVTKTGKPKYGDHAVEVSLEWKREVPELAEVRFFDGDGKEIESKAAGWSSLGSLGKRKITKNYRLKRKTDEVRVEVDLWTDAETVDVPVDLSLGLGSVK